MKSHTVKSNAKRAARKLCEQFSIFEPAEPVAAPNGTWWPAVRIIGGKGDVMPSEMHEVGAQAVIDHGQPPVAAPKLPEPVAEPLSAEVHAKIREVAREVGKRIRPDLYTDAVSALPAPKVSTREEILARREERRVRHAAKEAQAAAEAAKPKRDIGAKDRIVIEMLRRPQGATPAEIMAATGWQSHSVRRFMSIGNSKHHLNITHHRDGKVTTYRIA